MSNRTKCTRCGSQILQATARKYNGLCARCNRDEERAKFDAVVQGWIDNPETVPGTHGIPEPEGFALGLAASQLRSRLYPNEDVEAESVYHKFFDEAHNKWSHFGNAGLSEKEKFVLAIETFYGEVTNGGLQQYLSNESGAFAEWAVDGFEAIGILAYANIMRNVKSLFPQGVIPEDPRVRCDQMAAIDPNRLEEIEQSFWDRYNADAKEIRRRLFQYLSE